MLAGYVYLVTNTVNGSHYVGCAKRSIVQRWKRHVRDAKHGSALILHRAIRKYGAQAFQLATLEVVKGTHVELMAAEIRHITAQDCISPKGYNLTRGGDGVDFSVPGLREKQRQIAKKLHSNATYVEAYQRGIRERTEDPTWQERHRKMMVGPSWRRAQTVGSRRRSDSDSWQAAHTRAMHELHEDPVFEAKRIAAVRKATATDEWRAKNAEVLKGLPSDPQWKIAHAEGCRKRSANPKWLQAQREGCQRRSNSPGYRENNDEALRKARSASAASVVAKDALLSPEELARRIKHREVARRSYARKKTLA